jgi:glutaminase
MPTGRCHSRFFQATKDLLGIHVGHPLHNRPLGSTGKTAQKIPALRIVAQNKVAMAFPSRNGKPSIR